jgi:N-acetylglucosaminyl-diphospho-decaprenol L-rhamnosyltransferase
VSAAHGINVVIVAYNSAESLRDCVTPLVARPDVSVFVVDNASPTGGLELIADLDVAAIQLRVNGGFAHGCNVGSRAGNAPYVLFLNPDAVISAAAVDQLVSVLRADPCVAIVAPKIVRPRGELEYSQRRFPRLASTYARALFLHRILPRLHWSDELVRDPSVYETSASPEWVSGACLLIRRSVLEEIGGWDERFFMYCEDVDLCARVRNGGYDIRFEPAAVARHEGGASAPRPMLIPTLAASRLLYARKHRSRLGAFVERAGLALEALTHAAVSRRGQDARAGHARALRLLARPALLAGPAPVDAAP